jgi:hypothetical protein
MACLNTPATDDDRSKLRHRYLKRNQDCTSVDQAGSGQFQIFTQRQEVIHSGREERNGRERADRLSSRSGKFPTHNKTNQRLGFAPSLKLRNSSGKQPGHKTGKSYFLQFTLHALLHLLHRNVRRGKTSAFVAVRAVHGVLRSVCVLPAAAFVAG